MPAVPLFIMDPLWDQFEALIPPVVDHLRWAVIGPVSPTG